MTVTKINLERQQKDKRCAVNKQKKALVKCRNRHLVVKSNQISDKRKPKAKTVL